MKFTFKKHIPTGRYRSFETENHDIKLAKQIVGYISEDSYRSNIKFEERFSVSFAIIDDTKNCGWKWIILKKRFGNAEDARTFVNMNAEKIQEQLNLYKFPN